MPLEKQSGLEGVVAATTRLSRVDGKAGKLILAGYAVEEIAPRASFEEMAHLLWHGSLPDARELKDLSVDLASRRRLPPVTLALLREAARNAVPVTDGLRMAAGTLNLGRAESPEEQARTLVVRFRPSLERIRDLAAARNRSNRALICHTPNTAFIRCLAAKLGKNAQED